MADDPQVRATQTWLNNTYGSVNGWVPLVVDGYTGWQTIYGLRRGLQHELGISPVSSGFGPATTAAFQSQINTIDGNTTWVNVLALLSGSLWCKGYYGVWWPDPPATPHPIAFSQTASSVVNLRSDLGFVNPIAEVNVKLMAFLMSMDSAKLLSASGGNSDIREAQQWLNRTYSGRRDFALIPTDGIFSRAVQTAMLYALQYEFGMVDGVANGNFGPGTKAGLQTQAQISLNSTGNFVYLFQAALRFNGYGAPFTGIFDPATMQITEQFQQFMELPVTGAGDFGTWCALLVSSGDPDRATTGFDTSTQLTAIQAISAHLQGFTHVGRYTVGLGKHITSPELWGLKNAELKLFPIHQRYNNDNTWMMYRFGYQHGIEALERGRALDFPDNSIIYFPVDYDPTEDDIRNFVFQFFEGVSDALANHFMGSFRIGVYGTRAVCAKVIGRGLAAFAFVAGMSTGWSGNMGVRMPNPWSFNQIKETSISLAAISVNVDKVVVSASADAIDLSTVTPPPVEAAPTALLSATGFDSFYEWCISAESRCELAYSPITLVPQFSFIQRIPNYILGWLRKPNYWIGGGRLGPLWTLFTPEPGMPTPDANAREFSEQSLDDMSDPSSNIGYKQDVREIYDTKIFVDHVETTGLAYRDIPHLAATTLGYLQWGVPRHANILGFGDLGGCLLDLIQIWWDAPKDTNGELASYLADRLGSTTLSSSFSYADLIADVDAWLLAATMESLPPARALSNSVRIVYQEDDSARMWRFYQARFGSDPTNIAACISQLFAWTWAGLGIILPFDLSFFLGLFENFTVPLPQQIAIMAEALANALSTL